jgi:hypothetical protein
MHGTTIRIDGCDYHLTERSAHHTPDPSWARALIADPTQQHVVHLLAWQYVEHQPGRDHREVMADLEIELSLRFAIEPVLAQVA